MESLLTVQGEIIEINKDIKEFWHYSQVKNENRLQPIKYDAYHQIMNFLGKNQSDMLKSKHYLNHV